MPSDSNRRNSQWAKTKTFALGFIGGILFVRSLRLYQTWRLPSLNRVCSAVLPRLRANQDVRNNIGNELNIGLLSTYAYNGGIQRKPPSKKLSLASLLPFTYTPWSLQVLFQVVGENESGFVTVETLPGGTKDPLGSDIGFKTITIDFRDGQRLVLKGPVEQHQKFIEYNRLL